MNKKTLVHFIAFLVVSGFLIWGLSAWLPMTLRKIFGGDEILVYIFTGLIGYIFGKLMILYGFLCLTNSFPWSDQE